MKKKSLTNKINHFLIVLFSSILFISGLELKAQLSYKVLFLGNSYTYVNNLPQIIHDVALSAGDTLVFDSYAPGGYDLMNHSLDAISRNKIMSGGWDYVILQGQSQEPVVNYTEFIDGGLALFNLVKQYNPCAVTMPYMTWGRKNGDPSYCSNFPEMCTYEGMDTNLRYSYLRLTTFVNGEVSPVSVVWKYLKQNYPNIELYQPDESHPSTAGSYAAACCFYASIFKKDPTLITYDFGLSATDASNIRNAAKSQVFDSLQSWDFKKQPFADIDYEIDSGLNEVNFHSISLGVHQTSFWDFGDGDTSSSADPTHSYLTNGAYTVSLTTTTCDLQGIHTSTTDTIVQFCNHTPTVYTTHPWLCKHDTLWTQAADTYQWFVYGVAIPETNQYLPDYIHYGISGFSVLSTLNGCSELSETFAETPQGSSYYFDAMGYPCFGDTVIFAVLHNSGSLSGLENILWYRDDTLLSSMTNEDTLLITSGGLFECRVNNPNSDCPLDTASFFREYECTVIGIEKIDQELFWTIFPNPASEIITIKFSNYPVQETIQIFNAIGSLMRSITASAIITEIEIPDLPSGLYYIRLKNNKQSALKFIKL